MPTVIKQDSRLYEQTYGGVSVISPNITQPRADLARRGQLTHTPEITHHKGNSPLKHISQRARLQLMNNLCHFRIKERSNEYACIYFISYIRVA